jgi:hypothetical protein
MTHFSESHLSTLSHAIMRMSRDDLDAVLRDREKVVMKIRQSFCINDVIESAKGDNDVV